MDEKMRILISLGAASAANCVPCFEHYLAKADSAGVTVNEVREAAGIGHQVKKGAAIEMKGSVERMLDDRACESGHLASSSGRCCC
jgi:alkylhydroperoxidase/carboxymuconolactone decarboxylase family protein YurZ